MHTIKWSKPVNTTYEKIVINYVLKNPASKASTPMTVTVEDTTTTEKQLNVLAWSYPLRQTIIMYSVNSEGKKSNEVEFTTYTGFKPNPTYYLIGQPRTTIYLDNVEGAQNLVYTLQKRNQYNFWDDDTTVTLTIEGGTFYETALGGHRVKATFKADGKNYTIYSDEF